MELFCSGDTIRRDGASRRLKGQLWTTLSSRLWFALRLPFLFGPAVNKARRRAPSFLHRQYLWARNTWLRY